MFFFFQAEDGIRDVAVTGVQTCALPIWQYDGFADRVLEATHGQGVDVVFDSVGKATLRESFRACRTRGLIVNYGNVSRSEERRVGKECRSRWSAED